MPRKKKSTPRGGRRGGRRDVDDRSFATRKEEYEYGTATSQDEAANTRYQYNDISMQNLRDARVVFVAGERMQPPAIPNFEPSNTTRDISRTNESRQSARADDRDQDSSCVEDIRQQPSFLIDSQPDVIAATGLSDPHIRDLSPTPSDSSEEVILFRGRDSAGHALGRPARLPATIVDPYDIQIGKIEDEIHRKESMLAVSLQLNQTQHIEIEQDEKAIATLGNDSIGPGLLSQHSHRTTHACDASEDSRNGSRLDRLERVYRNHGPSSRGDAALADYIANVDMNDYLKSSFHWRDLGGYEDDGMDTNNDIELAHKIDIDDDAMASVDASSGADMAASHGRLIADDVDQLSLSDIIVDDAAKILSKRRGPLGFQYLIIPNSGEVDDARWISERRLQGLSATTLIEEYEARCQPNTLELSTECEDDFSDEFTEADSDSEEVAPEGDIDGSNQEIAETFSDESIARLLAKQEELGMGSDDLVLFDGVADRRVGVPEQVNAPWLSAQVSKRGRTAKSSRGHLRPLDVMMDPYNGFDVMDFERPSLKKRSKGRKRELVLQISDSELEDSMQKTWEQDRRRKAERKREREEQRSRGLMGQNHDGKSSLKAKYPEGIGSNALGQEIKEFLRSNNTSLPLPPMDKGGRKIVHELANIFNLKSKSVGKGTKRFPVLYRTSRTLTFNEQAFKAIELRLSRRYLPRMDVKGKRGTETTQRFDRSGFPSSGVSYRDGDVVGASAPELGVENRGRAMLEKMGWSTGTALGALNNKGILQPVSHIVKTTKAGLG